MTTPSRRTILHTLVATGKRGLVCPVCATPATPWHRPVHRAGEMRPKECSAPGYCTLEISYYTRDTHYGPKEKVVRCPKCSAAYWTDAEPDGDSDD